MHTPAVRVIREMNDEINSVAVEIYRHSTLAIRPPDQSEEPLLAWRGEYCMKGIRADP